MSVFLTPGWAWESPAWGAGCKCLSDKHKFADGTWIAGPPKALTDSHLGDIYTRSLLAITAAVAAAGFSTVAPERAEAAVVTIASPGGSTEIGARLRWGASGFEAALRDGGTNVVNLNPPGTPAWVVGADYMFEVSYVAATGTLSLGIDFNRDLGFGLGETLSLSSFAPPGMTSYAGFGFDFLQISGNESGSTGRSSVKNLTINGTAIGGDLTPGGALLDTFYDDTSAGATSWTIGGLLNFATVGTRDERPSWNFAFRSPGSTSAVPVPGTLALGGLALLVLGALRRRA